MFKKKTSLPARPPIPNKDDILEDINRANSDDVVFKCTEEKSAVLTGEAIATSSTPENKENYDSIAKNKPKGPFHDYIMITSYCEKIENLMKYDEEIRNGRDGLQYLTKELMEDMEKVSEDIEKQLAVSMNKFENLR